ncbi:MAG: hypothetical protein BWY78_01521 [Alphaproteobacteria bacterium ADurb.Bin438]|nr:MAG: hypothetical protein BWY78_01521 [Alphaproteobacteria bacterium ADurb.Bin438]
MVDYLITRLFEIEHKRDAINALISMSSSLIPVLKDIIENEKYKTNILVYLIEIIGKIMGRDGKDALLKCLINTKNRRVKEAVLKALNNKSVIVEKSYIKDINKLIYKEMKNISFLISCLVNIEEDGNENDFKEVVINAIIDDINQAKLRVVGMVNLFLKEKVDCKNILIKDNLDNIKACGIKLGKIEAFNNLPYKIILGRIDKDFKNNKKDIKESLSQIITSDFEMTTKWLRACGLKLAYLVDKDYFLKDFEKATTDPASVVRETAYKVLYKGDK